MNGRITAGSDVTLDLILDDGLGHRIEGTPIVLSVAETAAFTSADQLIALLQTRLNTSPYSAIVALERDGALVLSVAGYEIDIAGTSANLEQLGLQSPRATHVRFFYVDGTGQFLDEEGFVVNERGIRLDTAGALVNKYGYLIDENGNFLNEFGDPINAYGDRVDAHGNLISIDMTTLIDSHGHKIDAQGRLLNSTNGLLNGVGAIRTAVLVGGVDYLADEHGNLINSVGELMKELGGTYYLINDRGELIGVDGIPIVGYQTPVVAHGTLVPQDPTTLEVAVLVSGGQRWHVGSIQEGEPFQTTSGKQRVDLPERFSGGVLNTTGSTGRISIHGDKSIEIYGMVGFVRLDDSATPQTTVDTTEVEITSLSEVVLGTDALVNCAERRDDYRRQRLGDG